MPVCRGFVCFSLARHVRGSGGIAPSADVSTSFRSLRREGEYRLPPPDPPFISPLKGEDQVGRIAPNGVLFFLPRGRDIDFSPPISPLKIRGVRGVMK